MTHQQINRIVAIVVFLIAQVVYILTMAPTFSFWDCGEFIAVANTLGVPHPPGTPIFTVLGRVFIMTFGFISDIGARVNLLSTFFSAITVMITYLCTIRFIRYYRNTDPNAWSTSEKIVAYAAGFTAALALGFSDSFWFNAVEAEVYAMSMFFNTIVVWLILKWYDVANDDGNEKWLMLIAYMFGLALAVHLQALLAFFAIAMIYFYKRYEFTIQNFGILIVVATAIFFAIYPGIVKGIPQLLGISPLFIVLVPVALIAGIYYTHQQKMRLLNLVSIATFLIVIGYSSFIVIYLRSSTNPPINENAPNTIEKLYSYLSREQYGDFPIFKRRWSQDPQHQQNYAKYSSDFDFFIKYQAGQLYARYFGWQFIGRAGDVQDDGIDFSKFWGIPFGLGLFGMIFHFRRDWKMALAILALLMLTGIFINVYANPPEPQPRERDYVYVGSFFAFAIWIGIGIDALFETIRESIKEESKLVPASIALCLFGLVFVNSRMLYVNYHSHDRSGNYAPYDYAYNLLNSCEKDGILFTNGDNDTFPLWYLQEVAKVRQDVRVVNLSLANTDWYILQLKNESPNGSKPIKMKLSDREIKQLSYEQWSTRQLEIPVPQSVKNETKQYDDSKLSLNLDTGSTANRSMVDTLTWTFNPVVNAGNGQGYIRAQDRVVYETIMNNLWERPIYFAVTVGESNRIGIDNYLRMDGFAYKVVPVKTNEYGYIEPEIMWDKLMNKYKYRNLDNEKVYYDENTRRMVGNHKNVMMRLASDYLATPDAVSTVRDSSGQTVRKPNRQLATELLDKAASILGARDDGFDIRLMQVMIGMYVQAGAKEKAQKLLPQLEQQVESENKRDPQNPQASYFLGRTYRSLGENTKAVGIFSQLATKYPGEPVLQQELEQAKFAAGMSGTGLPPKPPQDTTKK
jgi:hypothetical protein